MKMRQFRKRPHCLLFFPLSADHRGPQPGVPQYFLWCDVGSVVSAVISPLDSRPEDPPVRSNGAEI